MLLTACHSANAATFFVATNGNDSNPGTEAQPWTTLRKAAAAVQPGDTVRIKAGEYFVGPTWRISPAGTAEKPITYQAYGDGEVRISCSQVLPAEGWKHVTGSIYRAAISSPAMAVFRDTLPLHAPGDRAKIFSVADLMPNSFFVTNRTVYVWLADGSDPKKSVMRSAPGHVVSLYNCHYTTFDGLTVEYGFNGIKDQGKTTHHITIRNCTIRSISSQGIQPVARHGVIEKNRFQKIGSNKFDHGIYGSQPGTIIRHNLFEEISGAGIHQYHQGDPPAGGGCEFSGNVFRQPRRMTVRSGQNTYYTDIIAWGQGNNRIFNNVFYGEGKRSGISLNSVSNRICHNTFVGSASAIQFHSGKPGNQVLNNIVQDAARAFLVWPAKASPQTLDYNLYFNASATPRWERDGIAYLAFGAYQIAAGETHSRYENPRLTDATDARPRPASPAIDAGITLKAGLVPNEITVDLEGNPRPQGSAPDLGAYEHKLPASTPAPASKP